MVNPVRRLRAAALIAAACLPSVFAAQASAQTAPNIRVGIYVGSSALSAVTLAPAGPSQNVVYAAGSALTDLPGQSYVRALGYRDLVSQTQDLATGQTAVAALAAGGHPAYLEQTPLGVYDVFSGPYATATAAQAAASATSATAVYGPYGVLIPGQATLAQAETLVAPYWQSGVPAYPILLAQGGWGVLVGQYASAAAAQAELQAVMAQVPAATAYQPSGSELMVQVPSGAVSFLVQSQAGFSASGDGGVVGVLGTAYRGSLTFALEGTKLEVVNTLPLEQYLYGVVPSEMPASWAQAALEAQAVASRTYALYQMQHAAPGSLFDVYGSTLSQAYGGYAAEQPSSSAAVDATANTIMTYQGQPIDAVFEADSGGATENSENVWSAALPYLRGVDELPGYQPTTWSITLTATKIASLVLAWSGVAIGDLEQMVLQGTSQTFSGRPLSVLFQGTQGQYTVYKDSIRGLLRLPSTLFTVTTDAEVTAEGAGGQVTLPSLAGSVAEGASGTAQLPSEVTAQGANSLQATYPLTAASYILNGRGNGHGVGMSQDGAEYMAEQGMSYQAILSHYYTGVSFSPDN